MGCKLVLSGVFICAELKVKKKAAQLSCTMLIKTANGALDSGVRQ